MLRRLVRGFPLAVALAAFVVGGCAQEPRIPYTSAEALAAQPPGYEHIRVWLDATVENPAEFGPKIAPGEAAKYLALSGGGGNGAYGAGILNGWTQSGTRPVFNAVSGVSTGALIAPFAFLGSSYDATLKDIYTGGEAETLVATPDIGRAAFGSSLFGSHRLLDLVSHYVDADIVAAIAREHQAGRRLYVVTTNIDSRRGSSGTSAPSPPPVNRTRSTSSVKCSPPRLACRSPSRRSSSTSPPTAAPSRRCTPTAT